MQGVRCSNQRATTQHCAAGAVSPKPRRRRGVPRSSAAKALEDRPKAASARPSQQKHLGSGICDSTRGVVRFAARLPRRPSCLTLITRGVTIWPVIASFRCPDTEALAKGQRTPRFRSFESVARRKLRQLQIAERLSDLRVPPGNRLERLKGKRAGQHSIRINDQFRICFRWTAAGARDVEIVDYH